MENFHSNTTLVKVKFSNFFIVMLNNIYSNTTLVKVKFSNYICSIKYKRIQIQHLLKLNDKQFKSVCKGYNDSNTTLVKVKYRIL